MIEKIKMNTPLVEMDGDEMTRIIWKLVKEELLCPFIELNTEYYDLGLKYRDETDDQVTKDAAYAIRKYGVGVKCATITPNAARVKEYNVVSCWKKPITIARHAYGDIYRNVEMVIPDAGKVELVYTNENGDEKRVTVHEFKGPGVVQGVHNLDASIRNFAKSCFTYALDTKMDIWFGAKDTISKLYDHRFKDIFAEEFENYKEAFENAGIKFFYTLIDDAAARVMKSEGGYIWACKNYDGDVMSDMVSSACGSLAMMTSVLVSPDGFYEYEAAHGTVQRHYYRYLEGGETSTNSVATIYAWTGALRKRGEIDGNEGLTGFADKLEKAVIKTIEDGKMTKDLAIITTIKNPIVLNTEDFIKAVRSTFEKL